VPLIRTSRPQDVRAVANYLLAKAEVEQKLLSHLQLQKLTYLAHGWHLGLSDMPLFTQEVHAWPYGPVIPVLYHEFKRFGNEFLSAHACYYDTVLGRKEFVPTMDWYSKAVVDSVWGVYGKYTVNDLISLTHAPGTPWAVVAQSRSGGPIRDIPIPNDLIKNYYRELAMRNQAAKGGRFD
jgi:uncharacterized phage-associated protein